MGSVHAKNADQTKRKRCGVFVRGLRKRKEKGWTRIGKDTEGEKDKGRRRGERAFRGVQAKGRKGAP